MTALIAAELVALDADLEWLGRMAPWCEPVRWLTAFRGVFDAHRRWDFWPRSVTGGASATRAS